MGSLYLKILTKLILATHVHSTSNAMLCLLAYSKSIFAVDFPPQLIVMSCLQPPDHTIIIDDIPVYFLGRQKQLEDKLKSINPNYTLTYYKSIDREQDYVLAAYVE